MIADDVLQKLTALVIATPEQFARTFLRAQSERDSRSDLAIVINAEDQYPWVETCLRYAREHGFLRRLLRCAIADQAAGTLSEPSGRTFVELCSLHAGIEPLFDIIGIGDVAAQLAAEDEAIVDEEASAYTPEAINPGGFDCLAKRYAAQIQSTIEMVCRVDDVENNVRGTGVLIAPHLVATAAHVVSRQIDPDTQAPRPGSDINLKIRLNSLTADTDGDDRTIDVAEQWLVATKPCHFVPDANGKLALPPANEVVDSHDVAILRLKQAPGLTRGWVDVSLADQPVPAGRRGLVFHHHPGGADQSVSHGSHLGPHGSRFRHNCSSLNGSSGGPLVNHQARLVGLHHGRVEGADPANIGGGGGWLAGWWRDNPDEHMAPAELNPIWELGLGVAGTGEPVIGFESLQKRLWDAQRSDQPLCAIATMSLAAGLTFSRVAERLPGDQAEVIVIKRAELDRISAAFGEGPKPTLGMVTALAARFGLPDSPPDPAHSTVDVATDSIRALRFMLEFESRLHSVQRHKSLWLFVNIGDGSLSTALSESLGYFYRAILGMNGGLGKLVILGTSPTMPSAVADLVGDMTSTPISNWPFPRPDRAAVERYLRRWYQATGFDINTLPGRIADLPFVLGQVDKSAIFEFGDDWYGALAATLRDLLTRREGP